MFGKTIIQDNLLKVGDRVVHYRDDSLTGTVKFVDDEYSCMIEWDGETCLDFQWSTRLVLISGA